MENHYAILIDGKPYESAADLYTAKHLFKTVDTTINREYDGSVKSLVYIGNRYDIRTWKNILTSVVNCPTTQMKGKKRSVGL